MCPNGTRVVHRQLPSQGIVVYGRGRLGDQRRADCQPYASAERWVGTDVRGEWYARLMKRVHIILTGLSISCRLENDIGALAG